MKPLKQKRETEKSIETRLRRKLTQRGALVRKAHGGKFQSGWPDLLVLESGHPARWIEMKRPGGTLSERQKQSFAKWAEHGALIWVTDQDDPSILDGPPNLEDWL